MKKIFFLLISFLFISFVSADPLATDSSDVGDPPSCGDGACNGDEVCDVCIDDCGICENSPENSSTTTVTITIQCSSDSDCPSGYQCSSGNCVVISSGGGSGGGGSGRKYQCSDREDNDADGLCDYNGCYINGTKIEKDPGCYGYYDNNETDDYVEVTVEEEPTEPEIVCGDEECQETEDCESCPGDCGECDVIEVDIELPPKEEWVNITDEEPPEEDKWPWWMLIIIALGILVAILLFWEKKEPKSLPEKPKEEIIEEPPVQIAPIVVPPKQEPMVPVDPDMADLQGRFNNVNKGFNQSVNNSMQDLNKTLETRKTLNEYASFLLNSSDKLESINKIENEDLNRNSST